MRICKRVNLLEVGLFNKIDQMHNLEPVMTAFYDQVRNQGCIRVIHKTETNIRLRSKKNCVEYADQVQLCQIPFSGLI